MDWSHNSLNEARSPYLLQHRDNPVWWHEWTAEALEHARGSGKPILASVGYATCHWCHVMAAEAFSDTQTAATLNESFVCIKVDREERPDIDHWLMQFLLATRGHGGWPLNVFLTPDARPLVALTYLPERARRGSPAFVDVARSVASFVREHPDDVPEYDLWSGTEPQATDAAAVSVSDEFVTELRAKSKNLVRRLDRQFGGFGLDAKFPPHSSMLYLLSIAEHYGDEDAMSAVTRTLDAVAQRGLHDHLQGGFFRYCVDRAWSIPHFEKMLYDQAMLLWVFARAARLTGSRWYRDVAEGVVRCLNESFARHDGLFISAHDADTDHHEGLTYLWSHDELAAATGVDAEAAERLFDLEAGAYEGRFHLIRREPGPLGTEAQAIIEQLLAARRARRQPDSDDKVVTAWNALAGVALIESGRALGRPDLIGQARALHSRLLEMQTGDDGRLARATREGVPARGGSAEFLEDYAALLLLTTALIEEAPDAAAAQPLLDRAAELAASVHRFRPDGAWLASLASDLPPVPAETFDSPTPSAISLAEAALVAYSHQTGKLYRVPRLEPEQARDFHNLVVMLSEGERYVVTSPEPLDRQLFPSDSLRVPGARRVTCYRGQCVAAHVVRPS